MTGNIAFLGMGIAGHPGAPRIVSVLASMAGFAGGVYLATKMIKRSSQSAAHEGEQATAIVWPRQTTFWSDLDWSALRSAGGGGSGAWRRPLKRHGGPRSTERMIVNDSARLSNR
jgi:hypothetical protein